MLKPMIAAVIAFSLVCSGRADARGQPDPETVAVATELIITLRMPDEYKRSLPGMLQVIRPLITRGRQEIDREFDSATSVVLDAMTTRVSEVLGPIAGIYARIFTVSEMREFVSFYRTPTGQKFLDNSPVLAQEMATTNSAAKCKTG